MARALIPLLWAVSAFPPYQEPAPQEPPPAEPVLGEQAPPPPPAPPDGILPVSEIARLEYGPSDRPRGLFLGGRLFVVTSSGSLAAHDGKTGEFAWTLGLPGEALFDPVLLLAEPFEILLASASGRLFVIDGTSGEILRELRLETALSLPPLVTGDTLYLAAPEGEIIAFDWKRESERYRIATGERPLALAFGYGLLVASGAERTLTALDAISGQTRWTFRGRSGFHAPVAFGKDGERLYVGSDAGEFYCLDAGKGNLCFEWSTGAAIRARALVEGDRVYVVSLGNNLYAYDAGGGSEQWRTGLPGRPAGAPVRISQRFLVATLDGVLIEINPGRGEHGKSFAAPGELGAPPSFLIAAPVVAPPPVPAEPPELAEPAEPAEPAELAEPAEPAEPAEEGPAVEGEAAPPPLPAPPAWYEEHRIAISLRAGLVLLLGHQPPEPPAPPPTPLTEEEPGKPPPGQEARAKDRSSRKEDGLPL